MKLEQNGWKEFYKILRDKMWTNGLVKSSVCALISDYVLLICFILFTDGVFGAMMKVQIPHPGAISAFSFWYFFVNNLYVSNGMKVNLVNDGPVTMQLDSSQTSN